MSASVELYSFAPAYSPSTQRTAAKFVYDIPLPRTDTTLSEDISYMLAVSYFMTKAALKGFAIVSIPFWFTAMGLLSLMS